MKALSIEVRNVQNPALARKNHKPARLGRVGAWVGGGKRGKGLLFQNELTASPEGRFCRQKCPVLRPF
jgi:hypothetical protein